MNNIQPLSWDSTFFNRNIGQAHVTNAEEADALKIAFDTGSFDLMYVTAASEAIQNKLYDVFNQPPVEHKRTYELAAWSNPEKKPIHNIVEIDQVTQALIQLTFESGIESRFYKDTNFDKSDFEKLYIAWIEKSVKHELADHVFGVFLSNQLAGFVTLAFKQDAAQIGLIAVEKAFRGKGIAKALIEHCVVNAFESGNMPVKIVTQAHNIAACSLYESMGFTETSSVPLFHIWKNR
ncbi:GNAT family N-acetyltransferase [Cytophaga hutchinsonii]|uniref:Acetyltransferase, GNAT family n=1 Tax=Cytophaga hutchinsonii (strain ATCC 33406 / DSM 1761 / CIP 103989 / NBRC 15051 / NCIMB 9469 / D465) TaxID=269798 RepID=A0A6N4SV86_CYTH3|nr:GNAT family N-acetyltransferase [Cytophaga hutchinsonii]ABG60239.1 acetyltransferase, GNAT family [Cytophaga hutchinsonii ATCC 33406]SFX21063.1 Acetyltransferase (GNAT) domain-containing protein [Cytophaga hutchinsonii ATCC 33406]